jgi:hypothetical protein
MKNAIQMDSVAIIYIAKFIEIDPGIQKLTWGIHRHTDRIDIA